MNLEHAINTGENVLNPILTITIPTYRRERYLKELLQSIKLPQELWETVEIVVSDNGSEYDVGTLVDQLNLSYPISIHINETNIGATQNFINCVSMARGKYVWILGDDELLAPDAVTKVVAHLRSGPDWGLVLLSAANWNSSPPIESFFPDYSHAVQAVEKIDAEIPLKQTLLSVVVFRRTDFDYQLAYKKFFSNYGQAFGIFNRAGDRPALVLSSADPVVIVREIRAVSEELPPRLVATQVRYLKYIARRFKAPNQRKFAMKFLWRNRINFLIDRTLRLWKRISPSTYRYFQKLYGKKA
jgi:glycosyltransferase involved in cell wall biosynthesis